jgi:REP element-mobilizing transposase RayT
MARRPRVHFPNAFYHVIARGNRRQDIFLDEKDYQRYLSYLSEYKTRYQFHLYAYALMRNHVHLLLEVEATPLSKIMQALQFRYTRYFNTRYGKVGHLFQGRYKAILCDKDAYLLELVRYIHLNPIRSNLVRDLERYRWVSHQSYLGRKKDDLIDEDLVLSQFGRTKLVARRRYNDFIREGLDLDHQAKYYEVKDQRFLGEQEFLERIESRKVTDEPVLFEIPLEDIVMEVGKTVGITRERIHCLSRDRRGALGRSLVAYLARKLSGYFVKDVARYFRREAAMISQGIMKVENLLRGDEGLAQRVEMIEKKLVRNRRKKYLITNA